jgi:hypothetical protein
MLNEENFESLAQELAVLLDVKISLWRFWRIPKLLSRMINAIMLLWYCLCEVKERQMNIIEIAKRLNLMIAAQQKQIDLLLEKNK